MRRYDSILQISNSTYTYISFGVCVPRVCGDCLCMYHRDRGVLWGSIAIRACLQPGLPYLAAARLHGIFGMTEREVCGTERETERGDCDTWSE